MEKSAQSTFGQHFMKPQKPFSFARKTDSHHRCVEMNSIPDQLKNILNNEFATVNSGLKLGGSYLAKELKDF